MGSDAAQGDVVRPNNAVETKHTPVFDANAIWTGVADSTVKIRIPGTTHFGGGVFVSSGEPHSCEIVTLSHITDGKSEILVDTMDGRTAAAKMVKTDRANQIAIYQLEDAATFRSICNDVQVSSDPPKQNEKLLGMGMEPGQYQNAPNAVPYDAKAVGIIGRSQLNVMPLPGEDTQRDLLVVSTDGAKPGYSGGGLYNADSKLSALLAGPAPPSDTPGDSGSTPAVAEFGKHVQAVLDEIKAERNAGQKHE